MRRWLRRAIDELRRWRGRALDEMRLWRGRAFDVVPVLILIAGATIAGISDPTTTTAIGTLMTAGAAAMSLIMVVKLNRDLVAIEWSRRQDEIKPRVTATIETPIVRTGFAAEPRIVMKNIGAAPARDVMADVFHFADGRADRRAETTMAADERPLPILDTGGTYPISMAPGRMAPPNRFLVALWWKDGRGNEFHRDVLLRP